MGEQKRRDARLTPVERAGVALTHKLANQGKLIEGGFAAYVLQAKLDIGDPRLLALRDAYMTGAEHLWSSIMATLDPGSGETPADMRRMDLIHAELDAWREQKLGELAQAMPTSGSA